MPAKRDELMERLLEGEQIRQRGGLLPIASTTWGNVVPAVPGFAMDAFEGAGRFMTGQNAAPYGSPVVQKADPRLGQDPLWDSLMAATAAGGPGVIKGAMRRPDLNQVGIFGGNRMRGVDDGPMRDALGAAKNMEKSGASAQNILDETGWFRNPDDRHWRFEISDQQSKLKPNPENSQAALADWLDHPELAKQYPEIMESRTFVDDSLPDKGYSGMYNPNTKSIALSPKLMNNPDELRSVLLHEVQHAVQDYQSFPARGANRSQFTTQQLRDREFGDLMKKREEAYSNMQMKSIDLAETYQQFMRQMDDKYGQDWRILRKRKELMTPDENARYKEFSEKLFDDEDAADLSVILSKSATAGQQLASDAGRKEIANRAYMADPGEIEARLVQQRRNIPQRDLGIFSPIDEILKERAKRGPSVTGR